MADMHDAPGATWAFAEHEHRGLIKGIDRIHDAACEIDGWVTPDLTVRVRDVLRWLEREFQPHIAWEESWLYPEIDAQTGTPWATRSARFDHYQIREMAARVQVDQDVLLASAARKQLAELRCHLFGLEALLRAHLEREERYLIPALADEVWVAAPAATMPTQAVGDRAGSG